MERSGQPQIPTLDGWRAIAILMVMLCHVVQSQHLDLATGDYSAHLIWAWLGQRIGPLGVSLFFGISGYLICTRLLVKESRSGRISLKEFYWRRAFRILPPAFAYLAIVSAIATIGWAKLDRFEILSCILFFRNYYQTPESSGFTGHFWSLAIEEHFYLVWPAILAMCGLRRALWWAVGLTVATVCWRPFGSAMNLAVPLIHRTDLRADALLVPCAMAILLFQNRQSLGPLLQRGLGTFTRMLLIVVLVGLSFVAARGAQKLIESCCIPLIIVSTVLHPDSLTARFLESTPLRWIGRLSYSLYLWQQPFLIHANPLWQLPLRLLAVFACASLSYYFIELPTIAFGRRLIRRMRASTPSAAKAAGAGS